MCHLNNFGIRQIHNNRQRNCFFLQAVNNPDGLIIISVSKKNNFEIRGLYVFVQSGLLYIYR